MGVGIFSNRSYSTFDKPNAVYQNNNPNPNNYKILKKLGIGKFLIVQINYPDCKNYEGNKILLFKDVYLKDLQKQKSIDPHFSNNKEKYSPIARFIPTEEGWEMAIKLAESYTDQENL